MAWFIFIFVCACLCVRKEGYEGASTVRILKAFTAAQSQFFVVATMMHLIHHESKKLVQGYPRDRAKMVTKWSST